MDKKLFSCVGPIPICNEPSVVCEFTSKVNGPHFPVLCSAHVFTLFIIPHWKHFMLKLLARPILLSFITLAKDKGTSKRKISINFHMPWTTLPFKQNLQVERLLLKTSKSRILHP